MSEDRILEHHAVVQSHLAGLEIASAFCFAFSCAERQVRVYERAVECSIASSLIDCRTILDNMWQWVLDGVPYQALLSATLRTAIPHPGGRDYHGILLYVLSNFRGISDSIVNLASVHCDQPAFSNIFLITSFLHSAYDIPQTVKPNPRIYSNHLVQREMQTQLSTIQLLSDRYTLQAGLAVREQSAGVDLFQGEWYPNPEK